MKRSDIFEKIEHAAHILNINVGEEALVEICNNIIWGTFRKESDPAADAIVEELIKEGDLIESVKLNETDNQESGKDSFLMQERKSKNEDCRYL